MAGSTQLPDSASTATDTSPDTHGTQCGRGLAPDSNISVNPKLPDPLQPTSHRPSNNSPA
ncbi:MAG: hypothetical protein K0S85_3872 [Pseudomonas orientalis]|nr:hypothetical protein [Pseudomonas orientalis]